MDGGVLAWRQRRQGGGRVEPHPWEWQHHIDGSGAGGAGVADQDIKRRLTAAQYRTAQGARSCHQHGVIGIHRDAEAFRGIQWFSAVRAPSHKLELTVQH